MLYMLWTPGEIILIIIISFVLNCFNYFNSSWYFFHRARLLFQIQNVKNIK